MSFLRDYLQYATRNEAPEMYHVWAGYVVLSSAISRRVWLPYGDEAIFPNIYVMLVGGAGAAKSTALRKAKRILVELGDVPISRSVETPEGLLRFMGGNPTANPPIASPVAFPAKWPDGQLREVHPMTIIANEFVNFINKDQNGWTNMLNDIFDEDNYEYRTKNMGEDRILGPYIVLLGALTTEISDALQKDRIIQTGFARRTLFQYGDRNWHDPHAIPAYDEDLREFRDKAVQWARGLSKLSGPFRWSDATVAWWTAWYNEHSVNVPNHAPQTQSWYTSKPTQILKVAMLTSLSESYDLEITIPHLEVALEYITILEGDLFKIFGGVGRNELAGVAVKIYDYVSKLSEPITKQKLKGTFWNACNPPNDFDNCISYLCSTNQLTEAMLTVDSLSQSVIALPEVMTEFASRVAQGSQPVAVPIELRQGEPSVADPSTLRVVIPLRDLVVDQDAAAPVDETEGEPPLSVG